MDVYILEDVCEGEGWWAVVFKFKQGDKALISQLELLHVLEYMTSSLRCIIGDLDDEGSQDFEDGVHESLVIVGKKEDDDGGTRIC